MVMPGSFPVFRLNQNAWDCPVFRFSFAAGNVINFLTISIIAPDCGPKAEAPPVHQAVGLPVLSVGALGNYNKFFSCITVKKQTSEVQVSKSASCNGHP